ncbi:MAG TPA: hypothetical protein PK411_13695 [Mesotoga infera]|nr:hypothetical protein [Mesotoga infera]HRV03169.1 hypothetical protein [Mesotoga sp.]
MHFFTCGGYYGDSYYTLPICPECNAAGNYVRTWSVNYQGKVFIDNRYKPVPLVSQWYREKETALGELRIRAGRMGYTAVIGVSYTYTTDRNGNYIYKIWYATGDAYVLYNRRH